MHFYTLDTKIRCDVNPKDTRNTDIQPVALSLALVEAVEAYLSRPT